MPVDRQAAVVMGECYEYHVKAVEKDAGIFGIAQESCLMPPTPLPLFPDDPTPEVHNLSICSASKAPFHLEDATHIAAQLCYDECHTRNESQKQLPPPVLNRDPLYIANCTRGCFSQCVLPLASDCHTTCGAEDYACMKECHANTTICSVPMGPRNTRTFRNDPNAETCYNIESQYVQCVVDCNVACHSALNVTKRVLQDDIDDWYVQECGSQAGLAATEAGQCVDECFGNCSAACTAHQLTLEPPANKLWYGAPLTECTNNCSDTCIEQCGSEEKRLYMSRECRPPDFVNCTALCFEERCSVVQSYCTIYDMNDQLRMLDVNCSIGNATFDNTWVNTSIADFLEDENSEFSLLVGVNQTMHTCYNYFDKNKTGFLDHGTFAEYYNMTTRCYMHTCIDECFGNCSYEAELAALPSCPVDECTDGQYDHGDQQKPCKGYRLLLPQHNQGGNLTNCSWDLTWVEQHEASLLNLTTLLAANQGLNAIDVYVPTWNMGVCEQTSLDIFASLLDECLPTCKPKCDQYCAEFTRHLRKPVFLFDERIGRQMRFMVDYTINNYTEIPGTNDTSGVCMQDCATDCFESCVDSVTGTVEQVRPSGHIIVPTWCVPPVEPVELCRAPDNCTMDCASMCFDPSYLIMTTECDGNADAFDPNSTVISLYYEYNETHTDECHPSSVNETAVRLDGSVNCSYKDIYRNITRMTGNLLFREQCVMDCFGNCSQRCTDTYCMMNVEEPINESARCLPRCMERFVQPALATTTDPTNKTGTNQTHCLRTCTADCTAAVSPGCRLRCEPLMDPNRWQTCVDGCVRQESKPCRRECVYGCTANHSAAYGVPAPYDATDDYHVFSEVWESQVATPHLERHNVRWNNYSVECYENCSMTCTEPCFDSAEKECKSSASVRAMVADGAHPLEVARATNNCTMHRAATCFQDCGDYCTLGCGNQTDVAALEKRATEQDVRLHDVYVDSCERKCRLEIYGRNITTADRCLAFYPGYKGDCMRNCTQVAALACVIPNSTFDVITQCNRTCYSLRDRGDLNGTSDDTSAAYVYVYDPDAAAAPAEAVTVDPAADVGAGSDAAAADATSAADGDGARDATDGTAAADDGTTTADDGGVGVAEGGGTDDSGGSTAVVASGGGGGGAVDADYGPAYDLCIVECHENITNPDAWRPGMERYSCDRGAARREAQQVLAAAQVAAMEDGGISLVEQRALDTLATTIPMGEQCQHVDEECVSNTTVDCGMQCQKQVDYYTELCVVVEQRNATFDYNISWCRHPDGWLVGQPKYLYYQRHNSSHPLATPPQRIRRAPRWRYDDVDDMTIMNCSCRFHNETYDPRFVSFMLESSMTPQYDPISGEDYFVSQCACLYNATLGEPQHCAQSNTTNPNIFDWAFNRDRGRGPPEDYVKTLAQNFTDCGRDCVPVCYEVCGAHFLEPVWNPALGNYTMVPHVNITNLNAIVGEGLQGVINATEWREGLLQPIEFPDGFWYADPECLEPCLHACTWAGDTYGHTHGVHGMQHEDQWDKIGVADPSPGDDWRWTGNCSAKCDRACYRHLDGRGDNATAEAFACYDDPDGILAVEGAPYCAATCECHEECAQQCVDDMMLLNTSARQYTELPYCLGNCTERCTVDHHALCVNVSIAFAAANQPPYVNKTETCMAHIISSCSFHCLGIEGNLTVNTTLMPSTMLPRELLSLDITVGGGLHGYDCDIQMCPPPHETCNLTVAQVGVEKVVDEASGNVSYVPILWNVTTDSYLSCKRNRTSNCLETCHDVGHRICFPGVDPFDTCVQSCVANLTYEAPMPEFNHDVAVCTKALRLTPSEQGKTGAAWHGEKQRVQAGFDTSFTFKIAHQSRRCTGDGALPDHETRTGMMDIHCEMRGGDGFAFVVQDSGATSFEPLCTYDCVDGCTSNASQTCTDECTAACARRYNRAHESCSVGCMRGDDRMPDVPGWAAVVPTLNRRQQQAADDAAVAAAQVFPGDDVCTDFVRECLPRCEEQEATLPFLSGTALLPGGCMHGCIDRISRGTDGLNSFCSNRCPLVDEDIDVACIDACVERRLDQARSCYRQCNGVCGAHAAAVHRQCGLDCAGEEAMLPSGELVERCRQIAEVHAPHISATCLQSCAHDDTACLVKCARQPPGHVSGCVDACPQNSTDCVVGCLARREQLAERCMMPCLTGGCSQRSTALGSGSNGVGYQALPNLLAIKFDTWYNPEANDLLYNHIAAHLSGPNRGASADLADALSANAAVPDLADGKYHAARIVYEPELPDAPLDDSYAASPAVGDYMVPVGEPAGVTEDPPSSKAGTKMIGHEAQTKSKERAAADGSKALPPTMTLASPPNASKDRTSIEQPESVGTWGSRLGKPHGPRRQNLDAHGMGLLRVELDGKEVLRVPLDLDAVLTLDKGRAYVGFTGATGAAYQEHTIAHWAWDNQPCSVQANWLGVDEYTCGGDARKK